MEGAAHAGLVQTVIAWTNGLTTSAYCDPYFIKPLRSPMGILKTMKTFLLGAVLLGGAFALHAAGFDCTQAATLVEKAICADPQLSSLDDALTRSYQQALVNADHANALKKGQQAWLKAVRNKCQDIPCLVKAYQQRLTALAEQAGSATPPPHPNHQEIVLGRCHMDSCWWWQVGRLETIKSDANGRLVKAIVRTTSAEYSSDYVEKQGYPGYPQKQAKWEGPDEHYVFCSNKIPTFISFDKERQKYTAVIPFGNDGVPWGYTEGEANLYDFVCNRGKSATYTINPATAAADIVLAKPTDIFAYGEPQSRTFEGTLTAYECGDNCYLTITDLHGQDQTGLCGASICELWGEDESSFSRYQGKKVRITVGKGNQVGGEGEVLGEMDEFVKIEAL